MTIRIFQVAALLTLGAGTLTAGSPVGSARAAGTVSLNGTVMNMPGIPSFPVTEGDLIVTGEDGYAAIATGSDRFEIRDRTTAKIFSAGIELETGVVASQRRPVRIDDWTVEVRDGSGWFVVSQRGEQRLVAAHEGDVVVRRAGYEPLLLPAGAFAVYPAPNEGEAKKQEEADDDDDEEGAAATSDDRKSGSAQPASGSSKGGVSVGSMSAEKTIVLLAGAGAAATGVAIGVAGDEEESRSPNN